MKDTKKGKKIFDSLKIRMMLPAVIFTLIFSVLFISLNNYYTSKLLDNRLEREAIRISNMIYESRFALNTVYLNRLGKVIEGKIAVFDPFGHIIAASFKAEQFKDFIEVIRRNKTLNRFKNEHQKQVVLKINNAEGLFLLVAKKIIFNDTQDQFFITILTSLDDLKSSKLQILLRTILSGTLALFIAFVFTGFILKKVISSVNDLIEATNQIASGDFQFKAKSSDIKELNVLAVSINQMSDRLLDYKNRLIDSTKKRSANAITTAMAHEIKNPLSSMKMLSQMIQKKMKNDQDSEKMISSIINEINRVDRLVSDLKTLSSPSKLSCTPVSPAQPVNEIIKVILPKMNHLNIHLETVIDLAIPDILMDKDKIKQILWNLMMNGAESMPHGGTLTICLQKKDNHGIEYSIMDNGDGIDSKNMDTIFTPFFTTKKEGIGIGLTISKEIANAHHGKLILTSTSEGTTAILSLPR